MLESSSQEGLIMRPLNTHTVRDTDRTRILGIAGDNAYIVSRDGESLTVIVATHGGDRTFTLTNDELEPLGGVN